MSHSSHDSKTPVDDLLRQVNARLERHRYSADDSSPCVHANRESVRYIEVFWEYLRSAVADDPNGLGMTTVKTVNGRDQRFDLADVRRSMSKGNRPPEQQVEFNRIAGVLAPMMMAEAVMNSAAQSFAERLQNEADPDLPFAIDASQFVSLRTLLPLREAGGPHGANAPTLVMGGTSTAVKLCWNLLLRAPEAFAELEGRPAEREDIEHVWRDTRELIFRVGSGSLVAFVALASACTEDPGAMLWPDTADLNLEMQDGHYAWSANADFVTRYHELLEKVRDAQQGHYVGCAALYARVEPLALAYESDKATARGETTAFSEILRWITAVAKVEYFPLFD